MGPDCFTHNREASPLQHSPVKEKLPRTEFDKELKLTLLKVVQVAEFHQVVAIVIVSDVDLGVFSQRVLHPGSFVPTVVVVLSGLIDGCYGPITVQDLPWKNGKVNPGSVTEPSCLTAGTCSVQTGTTVVVGVVKD